MRFDEYFDFDAIFWPFGGGRGPRPRRGRRRRGRWRWFERGDLKFAILALIEEKPMHGYEVMQALEEESAGCYKAGPGSIYPTLQLLEDQGFLSVTDRDGKKIYAITDEGRDYLDDNRDHVDHIFRRVSEFSDRVFGQDMSELSRSFSRLAQTTFQGAVGWIEDDELLGEMKDILNRAVSDMDKAWDAARDRRRSARRSRGDRAAEEETTAEAADPEGGQDGSAADDGKAEVAED